jgi:hypothetical protein
MEQEDDKLLKPGFCLSHKTLPDPVIQLRRLTILLSGLDITLSPTVGGGHYLITFHPVSSLTGGRLYCLI